MIPARIAVVGLGRVGCAFVRAAEAQGVVVDRVGRDRPAPALADPRPGVPILVCTRADDLAGVIADTCPDNRPELVFVQNGALRTVLAAHGLDGNTQGVLYFAATSRQGPTEPGAPSLFWGRHAAGVAALLDSAGIPAREVADPRAFRAEVATKLLWNAIFGLLGDVFDEPVGTSAERPEVRALTEELAPVLAAAFDTDLAPDPLLARLRAYSHGIPAFRAAVRELPWRNGWIADRAREHGLPTPLHDRLLAAVGHRIG